MQRFYKPLTFEQSTIGENVKDYVLTSNEKKGNFLVVIINVLIW